MSEKSFDAQAFRESDPSVVELKRLSTLLRQARSGGPEKIAEVARNGYNDNPFWEANQGVAVACQQLHQKCVQSPADQDGAVNALGLTLQVIEMALQNRMMAAELESLKAPKAEVPVAAPIADVAATAHDGSLGVLQ